MTRLFLSFLFVFLLLNASVSATSNDVFIKAIENKNWSQARKSDPKLATLVTWLELNDEANPNFYALKSFITQHNHWPKIEDLKRKIEENNFKNCKNSDVLAWFKAHPPKTISGKKKYLGLLDDNAAKAKYAKEVWQKANFSKLEQENFLKSYGDLISENDYIARLDYLLFEKKIDQATRLLPFISKKLLPLYKARIDIQRGKTAVLQQYKNSTNHIGILYDIASIYNSKDDEASLTAILKNSAQINSPYQYYFWNMKAKVIRDLIHAQNYKTAYLFASSHGDLATEEYSEAEWLAGWISLRFLDNPKLAIKHFTNIYNVVKRPISLSKASYWLGRSYEKLNKADSDHWYKEAAQYFTTFYGQLAACKINNCHVNIPEDPKPSAQDLQHFKNNVLVNSALVLNKIGKYNHLTQSFLYQAIDNSKSIGEIALITKLGFNLNQKHLSVEAAKRASYRDIHIIHSNYPILDSIYNGHETDPALVMALIRQESVFNHKAVSCAGAMGLMQLMPHVAKETASKLKLGFKKDKLLSDPHFNTHLGTAHLDGLVTCYQPSYVLCIAAYNAGDKAARRWIANNGDPRLMTNIEDIVDWIEKISFYETRNYVQRVLEGKSVYHLLMTKQTQLPLQKDLIEGSGEGCLLASK